MPTTREFLGDSLIKELEGAGFSPQSINAFAKNEYRQRKAAQEEEQKRLSYRADDMKVDGKIREALLSGDISEEEARNAQKFEDFGPKKHGWVLGAAKTLTGIANTAERVSDFINPFYEGKHDENGNYTYQNSIEQALRPKIQNAQKMRDDYEKATGETSWGSRLAEIGTEMVGDPINFIGGAGLLSKGSKLAQFGKKTLFFAGTGAASGGVMALGEGKNDEETLKNIGYGAAGGFVLGHAIDQGIQGISKLIAKRQASRVANEADAIDNAQNSEFLDGGNSASKDVSSGNGSLEYPNTQSIAVTIVRGVLKNEPLSTREQVLKEILSGEEKSSVIKPEKYKSILTGINEYKSYQNRLKHFHDNPDEVKNADLIFNQMQDDFMKANSGDTKKYYDAAPLFGRELKIAQTMTAREFATKEVGLDEDTATNVLKEAMQGKEKSDWTDADTYADIVKFKNFEIQRDYAKAYGERIQTAQASINNAREQSAIRYADTQKAINEYQKQGMSPSAIRELINAKFKPSADEIDYTRAYNDGADVDARLAGQGIFYALEKDIAAQAYTPEIYATRLKQRGFSDESVQAFTQAYINKDINIAKDYANSEVAQVYENKIQAQIANEIRDRDEVGGGFVNEEAKNNGLSDSVSNIGDNASRTGGRQASDEQILRQGRRNTSSASQTKRTAQSDEQMEQRSAFKTDGNTDATAASKQMVEEQESGDNEIRGENFITKESPAPKRDLNVKVSVDDWVRELGGINANKQIRADLTKLYEKHKELFTKPSDVFRLIKAVKENPTFFYNNNEPNTALIGKILDNGKLGKIGIQKDYDSEYLKLNHATYSSKADKENKRLLKRNENSHLVGSPTPTQLTLGKATEPTADGAKALLDENSKNTGIIQTFIQPGSKSNSELRLPNEIIPKQTQEEYKKLANEYDVDKFLSDRENVLSKDARHGKSRITDRTIESNDGVGGWEYKLTPAGYEKNYKADFLTTKADVAKIRAGKMDEATFNKLKSDLESSDALGYEYKKGSEYADMEDFEREFGSLYNPKGGRNINANSHIASGLVGGTLNSIDENGNFNPDERFAAGFLAGLAGSKAVAIAARKMTPQLYNEILGIAKKMPQMAKDNPKLLGKLYQNAKDVSINSFAGAKAITANVGKLDQAKAMLEKGADEVEIWQKTGWFKDKDGAWKFEIGDGKAKLNPNFQSGGRLGELLEHEELFKAYPELKDVRVVKIGDAIPSKAAQSVKDAAQKEKRGIYNVAYNDKTATLVRQDLQKIDDALILEKGSNKKGGAVHIKKHLDQGAQGAITQGEFLSVGKNIRKYLQKYKEPFIDESGGRIYEWADGNGVKFRVVVYEKADGISASHPNSIISFYSNRNLKKPMEFRNPQVKYDTNLKEWHKDSVPITKNSDGSPKVFYHGSLAKDIAEFKSEFDNSGIGFWFADKDYAANHGEGNLYETFLRIKNQLDLREENAKYPFELMREMQRKGLSLEPYGKTSKEAKEFLKQNGYDGIVLDGDYKERPFIIAFDSAQIKHVKNDGNFSDSPNIYKSGEEGYYSPAKNEIGLSDLGDKSTLMHEAQHAIQEIEDFARGSSARDETYTLYHGEAEARNVQNRLNLGGDTHPYETFDANPNKTIVSKGSEVSYSRKIEEIKRTHPNVERELDESIAAMRKESFNDSNFKAGLISKFDTKEITTQELGKSINLSNKQLTILKNDIKNADFKVISDSKIYFDKIGKDGDKKRFFIDIAEDGNVRVDAYAKSQIDSIPIKENALQELAGVGDRARLKNMSFEVKAAYRNELDPIKKEAILKTAELNKLKKAAQSGDKMAVAKFEEFKTKNLDKDGNIKDGLRLC